MVENSESLPYYKIKHLTLISLWFAHPLLVSGMEKVLTFNFTLQLTFTFSQKKFDTYWLIRTFLF